MMPSAHCQSPAEYLEFLLTLPTLWCVFLSPVQAHLVLAQTFSGCSSSGSPISIRSCNAQLLSEFVIDTSCPS